MKLRDLTAREGKVLRFVVCRGGVVKPSECVVKISWSDLPHTTLSARSVLERLRAWRYVERNNNGYIATEKGKKKIAEANRKKLWETPPTPAQMRGD